MSAAKYSFETACVRAGENPDPTTGAILTPIFQTATYIRESLSQSKGHSYSRTSNPTVSALEAALAALDDAPGALAFSTGMSALSTTLLALLEAGDHLVVGATVYGGTVRLCRQLLARFGVSTSFVDSTDPENFEAAITPKTKLILVESPANPTLVLTDIRAVAHRAHDRGIPLLLDNTFLTPVLQNGFALGADILLYSTTKYIEGHNATVGGAVLAKNPELLERIRFHRNALGTIQAPHDAWLTLRGLKTLALRMDRHQRSARKIAAFLESAPGVRSVRHPDLASFPQRALAQSQQKGGGGLVVFEVQRCVEFLAALKLVSLAESLGAAETLITHPASMIHAAVPAEQRAKAGISDQLLRLSVGLEDADDLIADLEQALRRAEG